jgi:hypothetical protein
MILRPYHSHHTLQKRVRCITYSTEAIWRGRYQQIAAAVSVRVVTPCGSQGSALKALQENTDRIYRIAMKTSLDWSNQAELEPFTMSLIFTRSITLIIVIGTSENTATHDLDMSVQSLFVCTGSPDRDSSRYGQVVRTTEKNTNKSTVILMLSTRTDPTSCTNLYIAYEQIAKS